MRDRERIVAEYHQEVTDPSGALLRAIVGLAVFCAIAAASAGNNDEADLIARREADAALLGVSQAGIASIRDVYENRRRARALNERRMRYTADALKVSN